MVISEVMASAWKVLRGFGHHGEKFTDVQNNDLDLDNENENTNQTSPSLAAPPLISDEERKKQLLRSMPTPKIPPFVKSDPPCEFHDDPSTWIEWLETEVLKFKKIQESKKEKGNLLKVS